MSESQGRDHDALLEYEAATRNYNELRRGEIGECLNAVHGDAKPCGTCVVCRLAEARRALEEAIRVAKHFAAVADEHDMSATARSVRGRITSWRAALTPPAREGAEGT